MRILAVLPLLMLVACATPGNRVPLEDRIADPSPGSRPASPIYYTVVAGDTLSSVARRFAVDIGQLQALNHIADPHHLEIGSRLLVAAGTAAASVQTGFSWPLARFEISSAYGSRGGKHKGVDLRADKGAPIRAAADGIVHFSGRKGGYGRVVILRHQGDITTLYAHNRKNKVKAGQRVVRGQIIATVGKSGNASGPHLHFEYIRGKRHLDPQRYLLAPTR